MDRAMTVKSTADADRADGLLEIAARDGARLRAARWTAPGSRGTVAILHGRAEFIEKYCEVVAELLARGFDVAVLDWRGQGHSARPLRNRNKGDVRHFSAYLADLDAFEAEVLAPFCPRPWFALGHSMGGAILIDQARAGCSPFERMVLTAPMIALFGLRWPRAARGLARALRLLGFGRSFIPGGSGRSYMLKGFAGNVLTSDPERYARTAGFVEADPDVAIGDPTIRWVDAAFTLMRKFEAFEFPIRIATPVLVVAAGRDKVTDTSAIELFARRLKCGRCITLPGAEHEILMERDVFRAQFWAAFDAFIPGLPEPPDVADAIELEDPASASGSSLPLEAQLPA
jgi:lysophospholipase